MRPVQLQTNHNLQLFESCFNFPHPNCNVFPTGVSRELLQFSYGCYLKYDAVICLAFVQRCYVILCAYLFDFVRPSSATHHLTPTCCDHGYKQKYNSFTLREMLWLHFSEGNYLNLLGSVTMLLHIAMLLCSMLHIVQVQQIE